MFFIAGSGHCGTKWLAYALTHEDYKVLCFHEYRHKYLNLDWKQAMVKWNNQGFVGFQKYFSYMNTISAEGTRVGDSNSWPIGFFYDKELSHRLQEYTSIENVIFLIRNGINTVHSWIKHNRETDGVHQLFKTTPGLWKEYKDKIVEWQQLHNMDLCVDFTEIEKMGEIVNLIDWGACYSKQNIDKATALLGERLLTRRLEDLTQNVEALSDLLEYFGITKTEAEIKDLQTHDVNKKIQNQDLEYIVAEWPQPLLRNFITICGDTMIYNDYDMNIVHQALTT